MLMLVLIVALAVLFSSPATAAPASFAPFSLTVSERQEVRREAWPLTFGAPFPRGALTSESGVTVTDGRGKALPAQTRALARWPDGSVRWLLVDTQVDVGPGERKEFEIRPGTTTAPRVALSVAETKRHVAVDTGVVKFQVPKDHFAIVEGMRPAAGSSSGFRALAFLESGGRPGSARTPDKVSVLEAGPLRARVELRGTFGDGFDYVIRVDAYAGQPFVRVLHTFIDRNGAPYSEVSRVAVEIPLAAGEGTRYEYGATNGSPVTGDIEDGLSVYQTDNTSFDVDGRKRDGRLPGWARVRQGGGDVGIATRWFWQEYPKGFEFRPDAFVYELWPRRARPAKVGMGAAKTHELVLWSAPAMARERIAALATPLVAAVDPDWIARSGALPMAVAPPAGGFVEKVTAAAERYLRRNEQERWDDSGSVQCPKIELEVPRTGAFGMWNWGDWNFPGYHDDTKGCDAWGNLEYDTTQILALAFAASGRPQLHDAMVGAARHFMDVDRIHFYPSRPSWVGMNHPKNPLHFTFELGGVDLGHTWNEGLLSYYYLTGDERGREAAVQVADYLVDRIQGFVFRANPRQWGWPQIALAAAYEATHDEKYREAAKAYAKRGIEAHSPTTTHKWKLGVLADGLAYTHALTGDPEIEAWLKKFAGAIAPRKTPLDGRLYPAVAYVSALTGDAKLREVALARAAKLKLGNWGKPLTINGRVGFRVYSILGEKK